MGIDLENKYQELEKLVAAMISNAGSGHYASSMSTLEVMVPLFYEQGITPDCFILGKGHAAPALYAILYDLGYLKKSDLDSFRQYGGLPGHPSLDVNGVLCSSGSLGMGISKAIGLAYANGDRTYHVLVGDGELQEGQNWEAILYLAANPMPNVKIHIDRNGYQYSGEHRNIHEPHWLACAEQNGNVMVHITQWQCDNKHLTRSNPAMTAYSSLITQYSTMLHEAMQTNENIIVLTADLEQDFGLTIIKDNFPSRYIDCGISEQHMVSMAGGLARADKIPICHTFSAFYRRAIDQMYNNGCDGLRVYYVAGLCGINPINIGRSHDDTPGYHFAGFGLHYTCEVDAFFRLLGTEYPLTFLELFIR